MALELIGLPASRFAVFAGAIGVGLGFGGAGDDTLQGQGGDDALWGAAGNDGLRGFAIATAKANLNEIITLVKQHNAMPVLMQIRIPPNYGPRYVQQFSAIYPQLAEQHQITLWPFFMDNIATNAELMLPDGIHPNQAAQPLISAFVGKLLADLAPE